MATVVHVKLTPKKPQASSLSLASNELPPTYEAALQLPACSIQRPETYFSEQGRRLSKSEESDREVVPNDSQWDGDDVYSMDDTAFEPYDEDPSSGTNDCEPVIQGTSKPSEAGSASEEQIHVVHPTLSSRRSLATRPRRPSSPLQRTGCESQPLALQYDEQTYSIVSKLRALNRQLTAKIEQQAKQLQHLIDEKKQHLIQIQTLETDLRMVKLTLKTIQSAIPSPIDRSIGQSAGKRLNHTTTVSSDEPPTYASLVETGQDHDDESIRTELPYVSSVVPQPPPASRRPPQLASPPTENSRQATTTCANASPRSPLHGSPRRLPTAPQSPSAPISRSSRTTPPLLMITKIDKLEQDKRDLVNRHAHQLANYSHELSRLERQVEHAQKLVQAKDYELRLQKSRQLYACSSSSSSSGATSVHTHHHHATLLSDALWRELLPSTPPASSLLTLPFTTHAGLAFEQLLGHPLLAFHDRMVDATTRDWLHELRRCGFQVLHLHHAFQCMAQTFQTLATCSRIYDLADAFTREVQQLTQAEHAFLFVLDSAENEFWCRVRRPGEGEATTKDMITVRSRVMPLAGTSGVSAVAAEHTGAAAQHSTVHVPCGLASYVFHTKKPLLIPAGHVVKHPHFSTTLDNTDRLMPFKSTSTLLLPVLHGNTTLGVIQVCGKLTQVAALGVAISLEKCEAFTNDDQVILTMLSHFLSGLLPKTAYFTEIESNKVNEETLMQLAPEIFTCLRFEELGKLVIENAKEILDADRCSLFVADNTDRMLYNWQSDISGKGGVEVVTDLKNATMRIPFGHGMVGMVAETRQLINIPDAYEDPRFNSSWDKKTNYRTKSILTVPILSTVANTDKHSTAQTQRERSQHTVYGAVATTTHRTAASNSPQTLLGVVQVINKSGGAPFRAKDEFLLQTIAKLIALAIENSQLFQKTQALSASLGQLIGDADLAEAVTTLAGCAEEIIGVERAAIYVIQSSQSDGDELLTFHRKRRHPIVLNEPMYRHSLLAQVLQTRELVLVNDVTSGTPVFNAYVDSISGLTARNVLFLPLLIGDPEDPSHSSKRLIGVLHLVNTRGRKLAFEPFDLFLSIVGSQTGSVIASILEKQQLQKQQDQTKHLLDTTLGFFKEMSPLGIINAVYNTCANLFGVEKTHLFLWEHDHRAMWTAKLSPHAEHAASKSNAAEGHAPSLRNQTRRISVLNDQTIRVSTSEGLLAHVLRQNATVVVKEWIPEPHDERVGEEDGGETAPRPAQYQHQPSVEGKYVLRASHGDTQAGFTTHAVVACPVWDIDAQEIVGIVVLLYAYGRAPSPNDLGNLPHLSRQIAGALHVCSDLGAVTHRCNKLQAIAEPFSLRTRRTPPSLSLTLSARGQLVAFSRPLNVGSPSFSSASLSQLHGSTTTSSSLDLALLPLDEDGHRWVFTLSGASLASMTADHFVHWIGQDMTGGSGPVSSGFDRLRTDLQSVYMRKETLHGLLTLPTPPPLPPVNLPRSIVYPVRLLLWELVNAQTWQLDIPHACQLFDSVDTAHTRLLTRAQIEKALTTNGRCLSLEPLEWDLLCSAFADGTTDLVDVERLVRTLAPQFYPWPRVAYDLLPILDPLTQSVQSVHLLLTALPS